MKNQKPRSDATPSRGTSDNLCKLLAKWHPEKFVEMSRMLAGLVYAKDIVYEILRGSNMLEESVVYQDVLQQGVRRGRRAGKAESLLELIALRFGRVSPKQKKQIENLSLQQIKELFRAVVSFRDKSEVTEWLEMRSH